MVFKFKVKNLKTLEKSRVTNIEFDSNGNVKSVKNDKNETFDSKDILLLPFTGYYDSKGTEIYLGDTILLKSGDYTVMWNYNASSYECVGIEHTYNPKFFEVSGIVKS